MLPAQSFHMGDIRMDAVIIMALAILVVVGAFYFLGIGKTKARSSKMHKSGGAYSKRPRRKK